MSNYRMQTGRGVNYGRRRTGRSAPIRWIIIAVVLIVGFIGLRAMISGGSSDDSNTNSSDDIQTLESLLQNANVNMNTNVATSGSSNRVACSSAYSSLPVQEQVVAITFDSSGIVTHADEILSILKDKGVPAFFFLTGQFANDHADVVKAIADAGFPIGNHSQTHADFTDLSATAVATEVDTAEKALQKIAGTSYVPFVRPPYGSHNSTVDTALTSDGYCQILWNLDALDWKKESTAQDVTTTVVNSVAPGAIIMMQFGHETIAEALPDIIDQVRVDGYTFVQVADYFSPPTTNTNQ